MMDVLLKSMGEEIVKLVSPKHFSIEQKNFVQSVEYSVNVISSQTDIVFGFKDIHSRHISATRTYAKLVGLVDGNDVAGRLDCEMPCEGTAQFSDCYVREDQELLHQSDVNGKKSVGPMHVDTTLLPIGPGRVLVNRAWVSKLPDYFADWEVLVPPPSSLPQNHPLFFTSRWISVNVIMLDSHHVLVEENERDLIQAFKSWKIEPIPLPFKHFQTFGGSFHCATLDVRRA